MREYAALVLPPHVANLVGRMPLGPAPRAVKLGAHPLASFAQSSDFEPHHLNLKTALPGHLFPQFLERRARVLHDHPAAEAGHVPAVAACLVLIVVLLALKVLQVEFVDQAQFFSFIQVRKLIDIPLFGHQKVKETYFLIPTRLIETEKH